MRKAYKAWLGNEVVKRIQKRDMTTVCKHLNDVKIREMKMWYHT